MDKIAVVDVKPQLVLGMRNNDAYGESNVTIHVKATVSSGNIELQLVD